MAAARRICMIAPGGADGRGGIGRHVRYVTRQFQRGDVVWDFCVLDSYGESSRQMPAYFLRCVLSLAGQALRRRIALVHLHMAADGSVARKLMLMHLAKLMRIKVVLHVHGSRLADFYAELPRAGKVLLRWSMRRAEAVIALGSYWKHFLADEVALDPCRIHVMRNAVPAGQARQPTPKDSRCCRILFLGRIGSRKGVPDLLHAVGALLNGRREWHLICAGDGEVEKYADMAARLGIADQVTFPGWVGEEQARRLLARADFLVLPSHNEGLPMVILEAMAHALPVIATPVGAIPEVVTSGKTGLLVPVGDIAALASAMQQLIHSPDTRRRMGAAALATFTEEYSIEAYCGRLGSLYESLLAGSAANRSQIKSVELHYAD